MREMTAAEYRQFMMAGTRTGKVATVCADGRPHVVPIWFLLDGDDIVFTTWYTTRKIKNLRRDERLALCVDEETPPYAFVMVEGTAGLSDDREELRHWATRIAARYMGEERAEEYGRRNSVEGEWLVRVRVENVIAQKNVAD